MAESSIECLTRQNHSWFQDPPTIYYLWLAVETWIDLVVCPSNPKIAQSTQLGAGRFQKLMTSTFVCGLNTCFAFFSLLIQWKKVHWKESYHVSIVMLALVTLTGQASSAVAGVGSLRHFNSIRVELISASFSECRFSPKKK